MNNIYKVIWSKAKNCYVVASEIARSHTKSASGSEKIGGVTRRSLLASLMALSLLCGGLGVAEAAVVHVNEVAGGTSAVYTTDETYTKTEADAKYAKATDVTANTTNIGTNKAAIEDLKDNKLDKTLASATFATKDALNNLTATVNDKADEAAVTTALDGKADKATTLAGYGITDAYTKGDVDDKLNAKADAANVFTKDQTYTRDQVNTKLADYAKSADVYTKTDADAKFATSSALTTAKTELDQKIDNEIANRITSDTALDQKIDNEIANRITSDTALDQKIDKEIANRITSDTALDQKIDKEIQDRENAIKDTNDRTGGIARNTEKTQTTIEGIVKVDNQGNVKDVKGLAAETITTSGNADLKGNVILGTNTANTVTVNGNADFNEAVNMDKGLTVTSGDTTLKGTKVDGKLTVTDETDLKNTKVDGTLTTTGKATFQEAVEMDKGLTVTNGDTTLKGTKVDGKLTVTDEADLKNTKVDGTLGVTGETTLDDKLTVKGEATFEKNVTVEKDLTVNGKLNVGEIYLENNKLEPTGKKHDSATSITADGISNLAKVTELGHTTESQFTHNEKGTFNYAKDGDSTDWTETRSDVTANGVTTEVKDSKGNRTNTSQTASENKTYLEDKDGKNTNSTIDTAKGYDKTIKGENGQTSTKQDELDITNTAEQGTIKNDAKDIVNNATGNMTNTVGADLTTTVGGNELHEVTGKQTNTVGGGQENIISGGQINNITGDQTTTITGNKTETVTENVTEDYKKDLTTTVGGNEIHEVKGTKTETVEGKLTENFKGGQETNVTGDQTINVSGTQTTTATDINRNASSSMVDKVDNAYGTNTETKEAGKTTTDVSIKGTGEKGQYIRGANESRDYLIKGTLMNSETKTAEATSTEITDGINKASTRQDAKNLAGSVTNGTEIGVSGIHANDDGSVSIDSAVAGGGMSSVINQKKDSIQSAVGDGTNSTVIHQDKDNVTIASSNGTVAIVGKDIVNNASESITNKAKTMDTTVTGKATESYGELETTVNGQATENYKGGLKTDITGEEIHTVTGNQTNKVTGKQTNTVEGGQENIISGGQTNTITGGQINNITGDQTTTITGNKTETVTENVTEDYKKNLTTTVGGNEIHEVKGTKTETVEGKVTEKFNNGQETTVTGDQDIHVTKNQTNEIGGNQKNTIGGDQTTNVTGDISNTAKNITNAATETLTDKVGENTRVITSRSITDTVGRANRMIEDGKITDNAGDFTVTTDKENGTTFTNAGSTASSFTTVDGRDTGSARGSTNIKGNEISTGKVEANYAKMDYADVMNDLGVKGTTTTKTLKVTENATVGGTLDVTKKATFHDDVDIAKNLSVGGNATITGDVTAKSYKVGDKTYIDANGINANNQKITNVADGSISEGSKDAVNGGQLYGVKRDLEHQVDKVGANAAAMANLRPMEFDPSSKWNIAAAIGNYGSETAAAIGAFYRPNDNVMVNLSTAFGTGENMVGGGVSVRLGKGGNKLSREETNALKAQVADLTARMDALLSVLNPNMSKDFPDVPENHWAYEAVSRLAGNDIVQGYPDGEFHGERTMTRYEMAEIIYNALSRGAEAERKLVEEFKPELQAMAASEKSTAEKAEG